MRWLREWFSPSEEMAAGERLATLVRWALLAIVLIITNFFARYAGETLQQLNIVAAVLAAGNLALTLIFWLWRKFRPSRFLSLLLLLLDVAFISGIIWLSEAAFPPYDILYFLVILAAALRFGLAVSVFSAVVVGAIYTAILLLGPASSYIYGGLLNPQLASRLLGYVSVGVVGGFMAQLERAQRRGRAEERRRARELEVVQRVGSAISTTLEMDRLAEQVFGSLREVIPFAEGEITLWSGEEGCLVSRSLYTSAGLVRREERYMPGEGYSGWMAVHRRPLWIPDVATEKTIRPKGEISFGSHLGVPLLLSDRLVGTLELSGEQKGAFQQDDRDLLMAAAPQIAAMLDHARLYDRVRQNLERRVRQLSAIEQIDQELSGTLDLRKLVGAVLDRAMEYTGAETGALLEMTEGKDGLLIMAARGYRPEVLERYSSEPWPLDAGVVGRVARNGEPVLIEDISREPEYADATGDTVSELAVPISREDEVMGVLNLESTRPAAFDEETLDFVQRLAEHTGIAMQNARFFTQEQRRARELTALHDVSVEISRKIELQDILQSVVERAVHLLDSTGGALYTYSRESGDLELTIVHNLASEYVGMRLQVGEGLAGRIAQLRQPLTVDDYRAFMGRADQYAQADFRAVAGVPLLFGDEMLGVLEVLHGEEGRTYGDRDVRLLLSMANQAAAAIANARLLDETRSWATQLGAVQEITGALSSTLGLRPTITALIEGLQRLLPYSEGEVTLYDAEQQILVSEATLGETATVASAGSYSLQEGYSGWLGRNRQPLLIGDCVTFQEVRPRHEEALASGRLRSYMGVPLLIGDRLIGTVELISAQPNAFSPEHLRLLNLVAGHAAVAIDNARLYEMTERRLRQRIDQLVALQKVGQELNTTLLLEENLQVMLQEAIRATPSTHGNIAMYDEAANAFRVTSAQMGYTPEEARLLRQLRLGRGRSMVDDVVRTGHPEIVADAAVDPRPICVKREARSALSVPILYEGRIIGVFNLRSTEPRAFDQEHLQFAQTLATQAALAVGNARRYEELVQQREVVSQRATQLREILEIGNSLRADRELPDILGQIAYGVVGSVGFGVVLFSLVSEDDANLLERVTCAGIPLEDFQRLQASRPAVALYRDLFRDDLQISRSYFIPQEAGLSAALEQTYLFPGMEEAAEVPEDEWHLRDIVLVPMYSSAGELLGVMTVDNPFDRRRPTRRVVEALEIFANQAAIAVENGRLFRERERRISELNVLNRISQATTSTLDLDTILMAIYERIAAARVLDVQGFYIAICAAERNELRFYPVVDRGVLYGAETTPMQGGMSGWIVEHREPLLIDDIPQAYREGRFEDLSLAGWDGERPQSYLGVPMMVGEDLIGMIAAQSYTRAAYGERERQFLLTVANQVAVAIQNARLFREREQRLAELAILNEVSRALSSSLALDELLDTVHQQVSRIFDTTNFYIATYNDKTEEWTLALQLERGERQPSTTHKLDVGVTSHIIRSREPLLLRNRQENAAFLEQEGITPVGEPATSWLGVPLVAADKVVGVMGIQSYTQENVYTEQDLALLYTIGAQAAIAIDNARLFEERERRITDLAILNEVSRALSAALDLDQLLETVHQQVSRVFDTTNFYIATYDQKAEEWILDLQLERGERQEPTRHKVGVGLTSHVIRTRQPLLFRSAAENAAFHEAEGVPSVGERALSWLGVPLIAADKVVGVMAIQSYEQEGLYSEQDEALFSTIAAQAAIAIDNARLFEERERRITELAILNEVGRDLSAALERDQVTRAIYEQVGRILDATNFYIALHDEERGEWYTVLDFQAGEPQPPIRHRVGGGLTGHIIRSRQPLLFRTSDELTAFHEQQGVAQVGERARSWVGVPMIAADRVVGVVGVESYEREHAYSEDDLAVLTTVAAQAAVALENARLFEETRQRLQQVNTLLEVSRDVATRLDVTSLLQSILEAAVESVTAAERGSILLLDEAAQELAVAAQIGYAEVIRSDVRLRVDEGFAGWVCREGRPDIVVDAHTDPRFVVTDSSKDIRSIMSAPLQGRRGLVGVINLDNLTQTAAFGRADLEFLSGLASQAAVAIENARLFQEREQRIGELTGVNEVSRAISSTMRLDDLLDTIRREAGRLVDTRNFLIALYDERSDTVSFPVYHEFGERVEIQERQAGRGLTEYVIRQKAPVLINRDLDQFCKEHKIRFTGTPSHSWLGVPMLYMDRVTGIIALQDYEHYDAYTEHHVRLLSTIANQAAIAVQNARLFSDLEMSRTELETRLIQLGALQEVSQAISGTLEVDVVLDTVLDAVTATMGFSYAVISLVDEEAGEVHAARGIGVAPDQIAESRQSLDSNDIMADIVRSGKTEIIDGWDERFNREMFDKYGHANLVRVYAPLVARGKVVGLIEAGYAREVRSTITQDDIEVLQTFLAQASIAIDNARLFAEIRRFTEELERMVEARTQQLQDEKNRLEALHTITTELSSSLDLDEILLKTIDLASMATGRSLGMVLLREPGSTDLVCRAMLDEGNQLRPGRQVIALATAAALRKVLEEREPLRIEDLSADPRAAELPVLPAGTRSVAAVPLVSAEDVVGVIVLTHSQVGFFDDDAMRLLSTLGAEVATAIHNAELYAYINDQALRLSEMLTYQQEEASKVRSILQSIADGVIVVDRSGQILLANPAAPQILGMRLEDLQGRNTSELPGLFMGGGVLAQDTQRFELVDRFVNVHSAQVVMDTGEALGRVYVLRDITKEVEADRSKSEFISTVSHELRTPLTSIKGYVDLILLGSVGEVTPMQKSFLDVVRANSNRLVDLINDILDISRVETGRIVLNMEPIAIGELVDEVTESARAEIERKHLQLDVQVPSDLPLVHADRKRIVQVLNNMVSNAYKYTREGGHIAVAAGCSDGFLQVSVTDSGVGISKEDLKKLFTRFFRADNPLRDEVGGTGLGLAISKSFVELHGGEMWVESEVDVGSTFHFTLPLALEKEEPSEREADSVMTGSTGWSAGGRAPLILVVDDEPNIVDLLRYQLERAGYTVCTARRGEDALNIARREHPDLITLDMLMAGMDGSEVLARLKADEETADIPVVIISIVAERENLMAMGAMDFLPKPLEERELLTTVERVLSRVLKDRNVETVLVGDDDPDIVGWLRRVLEDKGFQVREAGDGEAVLNAVLQSPPDLILLDLRMPKLDGREVITRLKLRSDTRDIPIIVITASSVDEEKDRVQILGMGAEGFLTKPFPAEDLVHEIGLVLSKKMEATKE